MWGSIFRSAAACAHLQMLAASLRKQTQKAQYKVAVVAEKHSSNSERRTFVEHSREMFAFELFTEGTSMEFILF